MFTYPAREIEAAPSTVPLHPMRIASILNEPQANTTAEHLAREPNAETEMKDEDLDSECASEDTASIMTSTSVSSTKSTGRKRRRSRRPRPPCKKYSVEQAHFLWYHRTDLGEGWDDVEREYEYQFGDKRGKGGLQCKFYRVLDDHGVEKVREQARSGQR